MPLIRVVADKVRDHGVQSVERLQARARVGADEAELEMHGTAWCGRGDRLVVARRLPEGEPDGLLGQPGGPWAAEDLEARPLVELAHILDEHEGAGARERSVSRRFR